jgi:uncharacterized integral membrane protein (TIGR00698 family)
MGPGLILAAVLGAMGMIAEEVEYRATDHRVIEALVIAMVLGVLVRNAVSLSSAVQPGATYASKTILELGVVVLGASINFQQIFEAGASLLIAVSLGVSCGMALSFLLGRALGLPSRLAYLVAVGNSICGNSAIAAVAPVVNADRKEVANAIGLTALAGVIVVLVLPVIVPVLDISHYQYGVVAGMAVYAVPQVVAAAFAVSTLSGQVATLVKLLRVMFLAPVVLITGFFMKRNDNESGHRVTRSQLLPWFVVGFFLMLALRSSGLLPNEVVQPMKDFGKGLTIWAMAGLGLGVEIAAVRSVGPRVGVTSILSMCLLVCLSLVLVYLLGIDGAS